MHFVTVPIAWISGFLTRRYGALRAILGGISFSGFVVLYCYTVAMDFTGPNLEGFARAWYPIAYVAAASAIFASMGFAISARAREQPTDEAHAA